MVGDNWDLLPGSGVNLEEYKLLPLPSGDNVNFIFIGRIMKLKGIDEYLYAARQIRRQYKNVNFYIAGFIEENEYKEKIKNYSDAVFYLGFQKNIKDWIARCHCTVLPSHGGEGVPNVLLESAAMGRICVGSDVAGTRDVIEDGKTGYLFEVGNVDSLVSIIKKVLFLDDIARTEMIIAGRKLVERIFNRHIITQNYMEEVDNA